MNCHLRRELIHSKGGWLSPAGVFLLAALAVGLLVSGWIWWLATGNPGIPFLSRIRSAEWIVYPLVPDPRSRDAIEMVTVFRRSWRLESVPTNAVLQVRAFAGCKLTLNNAPVGAAPRTGGNWKKPTVYDVAGLLRTGTNEISVVVFNSNGPPALWLLLKSGKWTLKSDETWQSSLCGAVWQPARLASTPLPIRRGNPMAGGEQCAESFTNRLPTLLLLAGLSLGILCGAQYLWRDRNTSAALERTGFSTRQAATLVGLAAGLWILLFAHNLKLLPALNGFDVDDHLEYIDHIRQHGLPLANEGWEMHHPPLYYLLGASVLKVFHLGTRDTAGITALRLFGLVLGLAQLGLVFASLRLIFPHDARKQTAGLILATFVPATLYLYQYVTNEILAATLATASVYCCLRILNSERAGVGLHGTLGLCLGAALLSKISVLAVAPVILGTLAGRLLIRRERNVGKWLRTVGLTCLVCVTVSGWHYFRVWTHFGHILVGNYDRASGFAWWEDPGYGTAAYFARFGQSLVAPLFSGFHAFGDGLYSTLWGDGLCGGVGSHIVRPPWNYDLMAAGYWLAVLPAIAIAIGLIATAISVVRHRRATWFLLGGLAVSMMTAMVFNQLKLPYYPSAKAFYGLPAMVSLCACGAWGMDFLTRRSRVGFFILWTALGTWAMNSYACLWIRARAPDTRIAVSRELQVRGNFTAAVAGFEGVLQVHPQNPMARLALAGTLKEMGHTDEALQQYESAWRNNPRDPECVVAMAYALAQRGQSGEAIKLAQQAVADAPDRPDVYPLLGALFAQEGQFEKSVGAYEEALRISPGDAPIHSALGTLDSLLGRYGPALEHFSFAVRINPADPGNQNNLARLLAALDPAQGGDPSEAVTLAERACQGTGNPVAAYLDTLAAAYAAAGRFDEAVVTAQRAIELALAAGKPQAAKEIETRLELYRSRRPYRLPERRQ